MSALRRMAIVSGSLAVVAMAVAGCGTSENSAAEGQAPANAAVSGQADGLQGSSTKDAAAGASAELRTGNHGSEDRVVLEFAGVTDIKVRTHQLNEEPPVRGGSGEPISGMVGKTF